MDLLLSSLPVLAVIVLMTKPRPWSAQAALGLAVAALLWIHCAWFGTAVREILAASLSGILAAITPLSIIAGAVVLFKLMAAGGALETMRAWLNRITPVPAAQFMVVGWAFVFLIEGASGFGTPAALAAPILVALGIQPLGAALFCLICDTVPTSFGAVGTPTWFGFSLVGLTAEDTAALAWRTAWLQGVCSLVVPIVGLRLVLPWSAIRPHLGFIYASILACVVPYVLASRISAEFPALIGGAVGLPLCVLMARLRLGIGDRQAGPAVIEGEAPAARRVLAAFAPIALIVAILVLTRLQQLPFKAWMNDGSAWLSMGLGGLGELSVSQGLVVSLGGILGTAQRESYKLLYVPALIPFGVVALACWPLYRIRRPAIAAALRETTLQLARPTFALFAALVFVKLMMMGGDAACTARIGRALAAEAGDGWPLVAPWLGALGAFFSGSATVSNLTFAPIQVEAAAAIGLDRIGILALQSVGGAMGNMICIHNIVAVCTILGLRDAEGPMLRRAAQPLAVYAVIAGALGLAAQHLAGG
jgi:lactate permease